METFRIFIAASLTDIEEAKELARQLRKLENVTIVSHWHSRIEFIEEATYSRSIQFRAANSNIEDMGQANTMIILTKNTSTSGGRHFEHGYAVMRNIAIFFIGKTEENVYQQLQNAGVYFTDIEDFLKKITGNYFKA